VDNFWFKPSYLHTFWVCPLTIKNSLLLGLLACTLCQFTGILLTRPKATNPTTVAVVVSLGQFYGLQTHALSSNSPITIPGIH